MNNKSAAEGRLTQRVRPAFHFEMQVQRTAAEAYFRSHSETGFTLVEAMTTIAIIGIMSAMGFMITMKVMPNVRADASMQQTASQFRLARETSIDQRRNILVTFKGTAQVVTSRQELDITTTPPTVTGTTILADYILPQGIQFTLVAGVPDTPDALGNAQADNFNCASLLPAPCTITFLSDGSVVDTNGALVNGTLFIGTPGQAQTARAVTILGATGRIRGYRYTGAVWH